MKYLPRGVSQLRPRTPVVRPEPLPSVKEAGFLSRKLLLIQVAFIGRKLPAFRRFHGKSIAALVLGMTGVTLDPLPVKFVPPAYRIETLPEILVAETLARTPSPAKALPFLHPAASHGIDEVS